MIQYIFNLIDNLTKLDLVCCGIIYLMLALLLINLWTKFKFINIANYCALTVMLVCIGGCLSIHLFIPSYFQEIQHLIFVKVLFLVAFILFIATIFGELSQKQNKNISILEQYVQNKNENTDHTQTHSKQTQANINQEIVGTYNNYDYFYNKEDKYAEPNTTKNTQNVIIDNNAQTTKLSQITETMLKKQENNEMYNVVNTEHPENNNNLQATSANNDIKDENKIEQIKHEEINIQNTINEKKNLQEQTVINTNQNKLVISNIEQRNVMQEQKHSENHENNTNINNDIENQIQQYLMKIDELKTKQALLNDNTKQDNIATNVLENQINNTNIQTAELNIQNNKNNTELLNNANIDIKQTASDDLNNTTQQPTTIQTINHDVAIKSNTNGEITIEKTIDITKIEKNILDKVKIMLEENNATMDEKFGIVRADLGNLKDGVQGMVDRMTKLFELLAVTIQKNSNNQ